MRSQSAIDTMTAYGIALVIIIIASYVVLRLGVFGGSIAQPMCVSSPAFSCGALALSSNGLLTFVMTQAVGGAINVTGVACSTSINSNGNGPGSGNIDVLSYGAAPNFYPNNALQHGLVIYSGATSTLQTNCYGAFGLATGNVGSSFTGYVWINYTSEGLPPSVHTLTRVIQFATKTSGAA